MSSDLLRRTPDGSDAEIEALEAVVALVRDDVVTLEREIACLQTELHEFRAARAFVLGSLYAELDRADAEVAAELLKRRPADEVLVTRARAAQARAAKSSEHAEAMRRPPPPRPPATRALQAAYHAAARRFHPDVGREGDASARHSFMVLLNEAYERRDEQGIAQLVDDWAANVVRVPLTGREQRLEHAERVLSRLRSTQARLTTELRALREGPEHALMLALQSHGPGCLGQMDRLVVELQTRIRVTRERLAALRGAGGEAA